MRPAEIITKMNARGIKLIVGDKPGCLHVDYPIGVLTDEDIRILREHKAELLELLQVDGPDGWRTAAGLAEFLGDTSLPIAVFRSRALGREFLLVRDRTKLASVTGPRAALPVLFVDEAERAAELGLEGLRVLLDVRAEFGPAVQLEAVEGRRTDG